MQRFLRTLGLLALLPLAATAQIGLGTSNPNAKAALDISATDKGLLVPRLTEAQRLAITSPPQGLMVYQTDGTASGGTQTGFWYYAGTPAAWVFLNPAGDNLGNHTATQTLALADNSLRLRTAADASHRLDWVAAPDGPELIGGGGGILGTSNGTTTTSVLGWRNTSRVGIGSAAANPAVTFHVGGTAGTANVRLESLGGTGTRMLTADASGNLATQAIPTNTDAQTLSLSGQTLSISGGNSVTLPTGDNLGNHSATQDLALNGNDLKLNASTDDNNKLTYDATTAGPVLTGATGGVLGYRSGTTTTPVLQWANVSGNSRVGIGLASGVAPSRTLDVGGAVRLRSLSTAGVVLTDGTGVLSSEANQTLSLSGQTLSISGTGGNSVTLPSSGGSPTGAAGGDLTGTYPNPTVTASAITSAKLADNAVTNAKVADDAIGIPELSATGTPSATTYLRGDNTWATIAGSTPSWSLTGNATDGNQFIGTTNDQDFIVKRNNNEAFRVYSNGRVSLGNNSAGSSSVLLGFNAGYAVSTALYNVIIGARAGQDLNTDGNTFVGYGTGQSTTGSTNTLLGYYAGNRLSTGSNNVFIGNQAAYSSSNLITGTNNIAIGTSCGSGLTSNSNNILLGGSANASAGLYDAYAIGNNAGVTQANSLVIGNTRGTNDAISVGIGTSAPSSSLQVNGTFAVGVVNNFGGGGSGSPNGLDQGRINQSTFIGGFYELTPASGSTYYRLPTASDCPGRIYHLRFNGSNAPILTSGSSNIYTTNSTTGVSSYTMTTSNRLITVISDGTDWYVSAP